MESRFDPKTFGFDTMLNHHFFQKLKLIEKCKFNYSINTLTQKKNPNFIAKAKEQYFTKLHQGEQ